MQNRRPGRVVMLVDNAIDGDSRVQKSARAMAEAGWEVHLIGRTAIDGPTEYMIGDAHVHRFPVLRLPLRNPLRKRLTGLRFPLAYKTLDMATVKANEIEVNTAELVYLKTEGQRTALSGRKPRTRRLPLPVRRVTGKIRRSAIDLRIRQTKAAVAAWPDKDGLPEKIETAFWKFTTGDRAWRYLDPVPLRYELSYRQKIEELKPDLIHAHDFRMVGVAARAVARARHAGRRTRMIYDAHEYVPGLTGRTAKWLASQTAYEREHIGFADAVVTVSPALADMLVEAHGLAERPIVTLNAPPKLQAVGQGTEWRTEQGARDVREACGLGPDTPLVVYCGNAAQQRCLHTIVESLEFLDQVHAAFVINTLDSGYVKSLKKTARRLGVQDRVHLMPYVPYDVLVGFLSTADVGVQPLIKGPVNHEVALSTKFFEFMQAGLPVVVSDVKAMADEVTRVGHGEVFRSEDGKDLARAIGAVLNDRDRYTAVYGEPGVLDQWSWEAQAEKYIALYERLLKDLD